MVDSVRRDPHLEALSRCNGNEFYGHSLALGSVRALVNGVRVSAADEEYRTAIRGGLTAEEYRWKLTRDS
jgi:hypothetical protein